MTNSIFGAFDRSLVAAAVVLLAEPGRAAAAQAPPNSLTVFRSRK